MSRTTPRRDTPPPSPRYTRARGIGRDRIRWPRSMGTFRHLPTTEHTPTEETTDGDQLPTDDS